jgi:hypothetical protein
MNRTVAEIIRGTAERMGNLFAHAVANIISVVSVISVVNLPLLFHIERGAHGVLNKNKNFAKNFISRFHNHLPPKNSCGRTPIFARGAHIRAIYRGTMWFSPL